MIRLILLCTLFGCSQCTQAAQRIVSLDYCADQYVLKFSDRHHIVGLSQDATRQFSYMREAAKGIPSVKSNAESVLLSKPDIVVRSYGGGPGIAAFLERQGIHVVQLGYANSLSDVKNIILDVSDALGNADQGQALVQRMETRLTEIADANIGSEGFRTLYMTPTGVTSGPGTLVHELLIAAGLSNFQSRDGWQSLPLERLVYETPDAVALAFFESLTDHANAWSAMRHPIARKQIDLALAVPLQGAWTACGGWFLLDAIEALHTTAMRAPQTRE